MKDLAPPNIDLHLNRGRRGGKLVFKEDDFLREDHAHCIRPIIGLSRTLIRYPRVWFDGSGNCVTKVNKG